MKQLIQYSHVLQNNRTVSALIRAFSHTEVELSQTIRGLSQVDSLMHADLISSYYEWTSAGLPVAKPATMPIMDYLGIVAYDSLLSWFTH